MCRALRECRRPDNGQDQHGPSACNQSAALQRSHRSAITPLDSVATLAREVDHGQTVARAWQRADAYSGSPAGSPTH
jgi:hypothetical protein